MTDLQTDRAWFKKNPSTNVRLRKPVPGEVEEITKRAISEGAYEIAQRGGTFEPPAPHVRWMIMVINAAPGILLRMLALSDVNALEGNERDDFVLYAVLKGQRVILDKSAG
jgi:hypothetical protein